MRWGQGHGKVRNTPLIYVNIGQHVYMKSLLNFQWGFSSYNVTICIVACTDHMLRNLLKIIFTIWDLNNEIFFFLVLLLWRGMEPYYVIPHRSTLFKNMIDIKLCSIKFQYIRSLAEGSFHIRIQKGISKGFIYRSSPNVTSNNERIWVNELNSIAPEITRTP